MSCVTKNSFVNEQKIWLRLDEPFRIHGREIMLYDSSSGAEDWRVVHQEYRIAVEKQNNVKIYSNGAFNFTVWNHRQWNANLRVGSNSINVNNMYRVYDRKVEMHHTDSVERNLASGVRLELLGQGVLHRIEMRMPGMKWSSIFIFGRDVLSVRPNGDFYADRMQRAFHHVSQKTMEYEQTKKDLKFVIQTSAPMNEIAKGVVTREFGTQTDAPNDDEKETLTKADVKAAIAEAMTEMKITASQVHPWNEYAGAASLQAQSELKGESANAAKPEPAESHVETEWSYVFRSKPKPVNPRDLEIRQQNQALFGGLFDMKISDDGDDEKSL